MQLWPASVLVSAVFAIRMGPLQIVSADQRRSTAGPEMKMSSPHAIWRPSAEPRRLVRESIYRGLFSCYSGLLAFSAL